MRFYCKIGLAAYQPTVTAATPVDRHSAYARPLLAAGTARPTGRANHYRPYGRGKENGMSFTNKAKNKAQELTGQAKEKSGKATGDEDLQAQGEKDQAAGNVKQAGEKVKDVFK